MYQNNSQQNILNVQNSQNNRNSGISVSGNAEGYYAAKAKIWADFAEENAYKSQEYLETIQTIAADFETLSETKKNEISTHAAQQINQITGIAQNANNTITENYTSSITNLENTKNEALRELDSCRPTNVIPIFEYNTERTDSGVLSEIKYRAHSTFCGTQAGNASPLDPKKFTVEGSPIVSNDGIVKTNLSVSNSIRTTNFTQKNFLNHSWTFGGRYYINLISGYIFCFSGSWTAWGGVLVESGKLKLALKTGTAEDASLEGEKLNFSIAEEGWYDIDVSFDIETGVYTLKAVNVQTGISQQASWTATSSNKQLYSINEATENTLRAAFNTNAANNTICDLKYFAITVDGIPVFSGNKTGVDVIKADDYTEVGTVTFTPDGIASGFSNTNYLNTSVLLADLKNKSWSITSKWIDTGAVVTGNYDNFTLIGLYSFASTAYGQVFFYKAAKQIKFFGRFGNANSYIDGAPSITYTFSNLPTQFKVKLDFDYITGKYTLFLDTGSGFFEAGNYTPTSVEKQLYAIATDSTNKVFLGFASSGTQTDAIDLNSFKIYVDGDLVYQPCLKIPYTESKTGSKIVNSIYRDRVNDMYEQFGYAPYYTLSDNNFTLPMGELYGLIDKNINNSFTHITDTYINNESGYVVYSDNYCEQWGKTSALTATTAITLLKNYIDTCYFIHLAPYTTNSNILKTSILSDQKNVNGFSVITDDTSGGLYWKCCGFLEN